MESISLGGRPVPGFALGESVTVSATPVVAALMVGATVGLLAHVLPASTGAAILYGAGATVLAKIGMDKASA